MSFAAAQREARKTVETEPLTPGTRLDSARTIGHGTQQRLSDSATQKVDRKCHSGSLGFTI